MATRTLNRLSANLVKALAERGYYADGGGLYFRVSEFGTRLWAFRYARAGRAREMGLGPYPEVTLKDARELALEARKLLREDQDPIEKRQARRSAVAADRQAALTFEQCAAAFIAVKENEWKNAKHGEQWRTTLATYADPVIGKLLVRDVQQAHILKILEPIWTTKTETASRLRGRIENVLDYASARGYRKGDNPARWRGHLDKILATPSKVAKVEHHKPAPADHPYLVSKGVSAHGLRVYRGALVVPIRDTAGELHGQQFIGAGGTKRFLKDTAVQNHYFQIGETGGPSEGLEIVCIAEGFATGASIHEATCHPVAVAFHAGNLAAVAQAIRDKHPKADLVLCADDDRETTGNPGRTLARQAALAVGGRLAVPDFGSERPVDASDFNDLHRNRGLLAVLTAVRAATVPSAVSGAGEETTDAPEREWPDPEPLTEPLDPLPYPVDALPPMLRDAVREAQAFVQAPMALVACSALATLSVAAQGLVNVRRDRRLVGPVSLYLLAVADSGERKTTCDGIFSPALRKWESGQLAQMASELASHEAALAAFEAKKAGVFDAIKTKRRRSQDTAKEEGGLDDLAREAPQPMVVTRLLYGAG